MCRAHLIELPDNKLDCLLWFVSRINWLIMMHYPLISVYLRDDTIFNQAEFSILVLQLSLLLHFVGKSLSPSENTGLLKRTLTKKKKKNTCHENDYI